MNHVAPQKYDVIEGAVRNASISFIGQLDSGELLNGSPTAAELTTSDLTITNVQRNTGALVINNKSVAIDQAVQLTVTGQIANRDYTIRITAFTDAGQTLKGDIKLSGV